MPTESGSPLRLQRTELSSGLELVVQRPPAGSPSFAATYIGPAGWGFDPPGREGLALMTGRLLSQSSLAHPRRELARLLDQYGASLTSGVAAESTEVTLGGPIDAWQTLVGLLADAVLRPRFAADEIELVRRQTWERQLRERSQPDLRAGREFFEEVYPHGHPYRATGVGNPRSIRRIRREDLKRFHRDHFPSVGASLIVTAPFPSETIARSVSRRFSGWFQPKPPPPLDLGSYRDPRRRRTDVPMPDHSQVEIRVGGTSIARADPAYPALFLANEILGGRPLLSRLFQHVRERRGLVYHASSDLEAMRWGGYWLARAGTDARHRERVVGLISREVERLAAEPVPDSELRRIRESALGSLPLELESTADAHELAVEVAYHGLPTDFYLHWPEQLRQVRPADIKSSAERGMNPAAMVTVTAGPVPTPLRRRRGR